MKHELFEELDAFDPKWRTHYPTIGEAAGAAGVTDLFHRWRNTDEGRAYTARMDGVPNYAGAIKAAQEAAERLPFNLGDA
jgi:hypothetical protein